MVGEERTRDLGDYNRAAHRMARMDHMEPNEPTMVMGAAGRPAAFNGRAFALAFAVTLAAAAVAYALTQAQVYNRIFEPATNTIRVVVP